MFGGTEDVTLYYNTVDCAFGPPDGTQLSLFLSDDEGYVPLVGCAPAM